MVRKFLLGLSLASFLVGLSGLPVLAQSDQALLAFDRKVVQRINIDNMWQNLEALSVVIGPRVMGTSEDRTAAEYIASVFESYGYEVSFFDFLIPSTRIVPEVAVVAPGPMKLFPAPLTNSGLATGAGITAHVTDWGSSAGPPPGWESGDIALMDSPPGATSSYNYNAYRTAAMDAGAVAVVLIMSTDGRLGGRVSSPPSIPMIILSPAQGAELRSLMMAAQVIMNIQLETNGSSQHVIATRRPQNKNKATDEILIIGGHYDSVYGSRGANDNASSVVTVMELARVFADYPIDREMRFMAFGAEEGGGGASRYVESLSEDEKERITVIVMEMLGSAYEPQEKTFVATVDGSTNFMTDSIVAAGARFIMLVPNGGAVTGSDHVAFHNAGMDEALYARAYPGPIPWDPLHRYGLEPYYHTPLDTMEFMSRERLEEAAKIVAAGAYDILRPDTPNLSRSAVRRAVPVSTAVPLSYPPAYSD